MKTVFHAGAALLTALALLGAAPGGGARAQALRASLPLVPPTVEAVGAANPIPAWTAFCGGYPGECAVNPREAATVDLTARVWQQIVAVNRRVNAAVEPVADQRHWGVADRWDLAEDGRGDCEDIQLLKRKLLAEAGLPRRAMRMTVVIDEKGEGHAVLLVRTSRGEFVLDNKTNAVLPWHETGYVFIKREGHDGPAWVSLGGATSPVTTANR